MSRESAANRPTVLEEDFDSSPKTSSSLSPLNVIAALHPAKRNMAASQTGRRMSPSLQRESTTHRDLSPTSSATFHVLANGLAGRVASSSGSDFVARDVYQFHRVDASVAQHVTARQLMGDGGLALYAPPVPCSVSHHLPPPPPASTSSPATVLVSESYHVSNQIPSLSSATRARFGRYANSLTTSLQQQLPVQPASTPLSDPRGVAARTRAQSNETPSSAQLFLQGSRGSSSPIGQQQGNARRALFQEQSTHVTMTEASFLPTRASPKSTSAASTHTSSLQSTSVLAPLSDEDRTRATSAINSFVMDSSLQNESHTAAASSSTSSSGASASSSSSIFLPSASQPADSEKKERSSSSAKLEESLAYSDAGMSREVEKSLVGGEIVTNIDSGITTLRIPSNAATPQEGGTAEEIVPAKEENTALPPAATAYFSDAFERMAEHLAILERQHEELLESVEEQRREEAAFTHSRGGGGSSRSGTRGGSFLVDRGGIPAIDRRGSIASGDRSRGDTTSPSIVPSVSSNEASSLSGGTTAPPRNSTITQDFSTETRNREYSDNTGGSQGLIVPSTPISLFTANSVPPLPPPPSQVSPATTAAASEEARRPYDLFVSALLTSQTRRYSSLSPALARMSGETAFESGTTRVVVTSQAASSPSQKSSGRRLTVEHGGPTSAIALPLHTFGSLAAFSASASDAFERRKQHGVGGGTAASFLPQPPAHEAAADASPRGMLSPVDMSVAIAQLTASYIAEAHLSPVPFLHDKRSGVPTGVFADKDSNMPTSSGPNAATSLRRLHPPVFHHTPLPAPMPSLEMRRLALLMRLSTASQHPFQQNSSSRAKRGRATALSAALAELASERPDIRPKSSPTATKAPYRLGTSRTVLPAEAEKRRFAAQHNPHYIQNTGLAPLSFPRSPPPLRTPLNASTERPFTSAVAQHYTAFS